MTSAPDTQPAITDLLTGSGAGDLLRAAGDAAGAALVDWSLRSVHHRAGRSVSAVYDAVLELDDGTEQPVVLVAHTDMQPLPEGTFALAHGPLTVAVWRFPHDPYLPGLPSAVHAGRVRELLDELQGPSGAVRLRTRAYRPSRRAVVEVTVEDDDVAGRVLYLKVLAGDRAAELADVHRRLGGIVPIPAVVGVARRQGIVAFEALGGATLRAALVAGEPLPPAVDIVGLVEVLAGSGLETRRDPTRFADVGRHVDLLGALLPDMEEAIAAAAVAAGAVAGPAAPVHGDLHEAQILVEDGRIVGLLDVDGAGLGRVAQDLGSLVAHLEAVGLVWPQARDRAEGLAAAVAEEARRLVSSRDLACGAAGAWLGLATGPFRAQDEGWPDRSRERIRRAVDWAHRAG